MKSEHEITRAVETYADMIQRICLYRLKNPDDTQDVFQNVFLKYMLSSDSFESAEHEKAWLIRVTINACKDFKKILFRHRTESLDVLQNTAFTFSESDHTILDAVLSLPAKYKDVIYLHYYEGYSIPEMSKILSKKENTLYSLLSRGRMLLKEKLGGGLLDE